jgi:uncharacterized protein YciI
VFIVLATWPKGFDPENPLLPGHVALVERGINEGRYLCSGKMTDGSGGILIAYGDDLDALRNELEDEFHAEGFIKYEIKQFETFFVDPASSLPQPAPRG